MLSWDEGWLTYDVIVWLMLVVVGWGIMFIKEVREELESRAARAVTALPWLYGFSNDCLFKLP
jgi:hypothetical protein